MLKVYLQRFAGFNTLDCITHLEIATEVQKKIRNLARFVRSVYVKDKRRRGPLRIEFFRHKTLAGPLMKTSILSESNVNIYIN